jgi:hypothetical protein
MNLPVGIFYELAVGLGALDQQLEKVAPDVRLKIGLNLSRLRPIADAYERARGRISADLVQSDKSDVVKQAEFGEANAKLRNELESVELRKLLKSDLRLDDNPRVTGATLSLIWPILDGV